MKLSSRIRYPFLALAIVIGAGSFGIHSAQTRSVTSESSKDIGLIVDYSDISDPTIGLENAPVTMIEYASFTCSHCAEFSRNTFPKLKQDYIDTGKVRFSIREVYTHQAGIWASQIARCGPEASYFPVAKDIFLTFEDWTQAETKEDMLTMLSLIGQAHGVSQIELDACIGDEYQTRALVERSMELAKEADIKGTPAFLVNGELITNRPYEELVPILDRAIRTPQAE